MSSRDTPHCLRICAAVSSSIKSLFGISARWVPFLKSVTLQASRLKEYPIDLILLMRRCRVTIQGCRYGSEGNFESDALFGNGLRDRRLGLPSPVG